jgi:autotransporter-associated beta strand protein
LVTLNGNTLNKIGNNVFGLAAVNLGTLTVDNGGLTVSRGTLRLEGGVDIPGGTGSGRIIVEPNGTLRFVDSTKVARTIRAEGGTIAANGTNSVASNVNMIATTPFDGPGDLTLSGQVSGDGGLTKTGTGTLTLARAEGNDYTGPTTVAGGTLLVTNTSGSATESGTGRGDVTVQNTGTLGGTGTVNGIVFVQAGGSIAPGVGGGVGTLNSRNHVNLQADAVLRIDVAGTTSDRLLLNGPGVQNLTIAAGADLAVTGTLDPGTTYTIAEFDSRFGTFDAVTGVGATHAVQYNDTSIRLVPVPEPGAVVGIGAAGLGLAGLAGRARRRSAVGSV